MDINIDELAAEVERDGLLAVAARHGIPLTKNGKVNRRTKLE